MRAVAIGRTKPRFASHASVWAWVRHPGYLYARVGRLWLRIGVR